MWSRRVVSVGRGRVRVAGAGLVAAVVVAALSVVAASPAAAADETAANWPELAGHVATFNTGGDMTIDVTGSFVADQPTGTIAITGTGTLTIRGAGGVVPTIDGDGNLGQAFSSNGAGTLILQDLAFTGFTGILDDGGETNCQGAVLNIDTTDPTGPVTLDNVEATLGVNGSCEYDNSGPGVGGAGGALVAVLGPFGQTGPLTIQNGSRLTGSVGPAPGGDGVVIGGLVASFGSVTVDGSTIEGGTITSTDNTRSIGVWGGVLLAYGPVTIQGGSTVTAGTVTSTLIQGSAVWAGAGPFVLDDSTVEDTEATCSVQGLGTVFAGSGATLRNGAVVEENSLDCGVLGAAGGGVFAASIDTAVVVENSTVRNNEVAGTAAVGGGIATDGVPVSLLRSTVSGNVARGENQAVGGGVRAASATLTVEDSTVSGNSVVQRNAVGAAPGKDAKDPAELAGGGLASSPGEEQGGVLLRFATVADNSPDQIGVLENDLRGGDGPAKNGVSAGSSVASVVVGSCTGLPLASLGGNWVSPSTPCFAKGATDRDSGDPLLGALANNGGSTLTRLPGSGSALIDGVPLATCESVAADVRSPDQRAVARPQRGACDIGAVQTTGSAPTTVPPTVPPTTPGGGGGGGGGGGSPSPVGVSVSRVYGQTAAGTAVALSQDAFPSGAVVVFVATRASFADGLVGGVPAGLLPGPLLLVDADGVPEETAAEIRRLGATHVIVLGGPEAVSEAVYAELAALIGASAQSGAGLVRAGQEAPRIERWAGPDRYATADVVAANAFPDGASRAFLATGENFPDALAVVPAAISARGPVLLTLRDALPESTARELVDLGVTRVTIVGGPEAVSEYVESQVRFLGFEVDRIAGPDRYATAAAIGLLRGSAPTSWVASGLTFPDALSAGPVAGRAGQPLLLVSEVVPPVTSEALRELRTRTILVAGGPVSVSNSVVAALAATG